MRLQTEFNRLDQTTPFGSLTFGGPNRSQSSLQFSPELQFMADNLINIATHSGRDINARRPEDIARDMFDLGLGRQAPFLEKRRSDIQERLEQSGNVGRGVDLAPGAVSELELLGRQENQLMSDLALQASIAGPQIQGQEIQNELERRIPLQDAQLRVLQGFLPKQGDFFAPSAVDVMGPHQLALQAAQMQAQMDQRARSGLFGGIMDLGMAFMGGGMPGLGSLFGGGPAGGMPTIFDPIIPGQPAPGGF